MQVCLVSKQALRVPVGVSYLVDHSAQEHQAISSLVQLPHASVSICKVGFTFQDSECLVI